MVVHFSNRTVSINGTIFQGISDKALSVGERSEISATRLSIKEVAIGAVSKDGSRLTISNSNIKNAQNSGLMAYIKKPEYGPAVLEARAITFTSTDIPARVQTGSSLTLEGKAVETEDMEDMKFYETKMKPGIKK